MTVAIIGALVAFSIPVFAAQTQKAAIAVDDANKRIAKAAVFAECASMTNVQDGEEFYFDVKSGCVKRDSKDIKGYGETTETRAKIIRVTYSAKQMNLAWVPEESSGAGIPADVQKLLDLVVVKEWHKVESHPWGGFLLSGTVLKDGQTSVITYGNNNWFGDDFSTMTLEEFADKYPKRVLKIDETTKILSEEYCNKEFAGKKYKAGSIAHYNGKYYILKQNMSYNKWQSAGISLGDGNWAVIKQ